MRTASFYIRVGLIGLMPAATLIALAIWGR